MGLFVSIKMKQWQRQFVSGFLSAALAGFTILFATGIAPNPITLFLAAAFSIPAYIVQTMTFIITRDQLRVNAIPVFSISVLFWFFAGVVISYFVKGNKEAIKLWFWLYAGMLLLSFLNFVVHLFLPG